MNRTFAYAELLVIGISATTIAAAAIGQPLPVVGPAVAAALLVAGHHVYHSERAGDRETTRVFTAGPSDEHEPDGSSEAGRRPGQNDDTIGDVFGDDTRADGGRQ